MRPFHFMMALLIVTIWGFNFVVLKLGLNGIAPLTFCALRFFLVTFPLIFFVQKPNIPFKMLLGFGLFMFVFQQACLLVGMKLGLAAGVASILLPLQVFPTIFLAFLIVGERPNLWQIAGCLVSLIGLITVGVHLGGEVTFSGFLLLLLAALSWAIGNIFTKKMKEVNAFSLVIWGSMISWPLLLLTSLIVEGSGELIKVYEQASWLFLGVYLYTAYLSTLLGYYVWNWLLTQYPAAIVSPFPLLVPVIGMLSSSMVLKESLESWKILAALLIIIGLSMGVLGPKLKEKFVSIAKKSKLKSLLVD